MKTYWIHSKHFPLDWIYPKVEQSQWLKTLFLSNFQSQYNILRCFLIRFLEDRDKCCFELERHIRFICQNLSIFFNTSKNFDSVLTIGHRLTWVAYHRLADIDSYLKYLVATYPDLCSVQTIGYSVERRPLKVIRWWPLFYFDNING